MAKLKLGIVGCGAIAKGVSSFIEKELNTKIKITAVCDKNDAAAAAFRRNLRSKPLICDLPTLVQKVDLVVEAASVDAAKSVLAKAISLGKDVVVLSVGALVEDSSLLERADKKGVNIYVPSGAICGVDGIGALSLANIKKISLITSKPPVGLAGVEYLKKKRINLRKLRKAKVVFKGRVSEAIKFFPKNINVAATLLLAASYATDSRRSINKVEVCIKADPGLKRNVHRIEIYAKEARVSIEVENVPSEINPKTSTLAILSTQYLLKKIFSSFKIGG
jgi:aspartate dehydrogenase